MKFIRKLLTFLLLVFFFSSLSKNLLDYRNKLQFYEEYKKQYENEAKRNRQLKTQLLKQSDPHEIEKTIRNKLNLSRPDEIAVILQKPTPTPFVVTPTPPANWVKWWAIFFKKNFWYGIM